MHAGARAAFSRKKSAGEKGHGGNGDAGGALLYPRTHTATHFPIYRKILDKIIITCKLSDTFTG